MNRRFSLKFSDENIHNIHNINDLINLLGDVCDADVLISGGLTF